MHLKIARLDPGACASGTGAYYVCASNSFKGCCTVNPCDLPTCPDSVPSSLATVVTTVVLSVQHASSATNLATATVTVFTDHSTVPTSTLLLSTLTTTSSHENPALVAAATTSAASSTESSSPLPQSSSNHSALIAGVVCGIVIFAILSILGWFYLRRSQRVPENRNTRKTYGLPSSSKDLVMERSNSSENEVLHKPSSDVFAPFGGRYKSPQREPAELAHGPEIQDVIAEEEEEEQEQDRTLPDMEKSRVKTPPVHEHPAYAAPGQSSYQPSMSSHPAYHVSHLNTHPAFRNVKVSPALQGRSRPSVHASYQIATPMAGHMDEVVSPIISSPLMSSPIAGHSELEADVPVSYVSPIEDNTNNRYSIPQQNTTSGSRERTSSRRLRQSIPIGLHNSTSTHNYQIGLRVDVARPSSSVPSLPLSNTFVPASNSPWRRSGNTPLAHIRTNSRPFISTGEEIVSKIEHPTPRSSSNSLQNQPIISRLEPSHQAQHRNTVYSCADEKEMGLSVPSSSSHPSQRWSDATMVTAGPQHTSNPASLSVPNLIAAACLAASPDPSYRSDDEGNTPTSIYTNGTATWGSWAAR